MNGVSLLKIKQRTDFSSKTPPDGGLLLSDMAGERQKLAEGGCRYIQLGLPTRSPARGTNKTSKLTYKRSRKAKEEKLQNRK